MANIDEYDHYYYEEDGQEYYAPEVEDEDDDPTRAWVHAIIEKDNEILTLTRNAEIAVAVFSALCALTVHVGMVVFSMAKRKHGNEDASWKWKILIHLWTVAVHLQAMSFYVLPVLTLLSFSPLLWIFMVYLLVGVVSHQWSLFVAKPKDDDNDIVNEAPPKILMASVIVEPRAPRKPRIKKQGSRRRF